MEDAPSGACILYAISCGLSDKEPGDQFDILVKTGGHAEETENEEGATTEDADAELEEGTGSKVKLKPWQQRTAR